MIKTEDRLPGNLDDEDFTEGMNEEICRLAASVGLVHEEDCGMGCFVKEQSHGMARDHLKLVCLRQGSRSVRL